jgi:predicted  nucleic acid-binding Zn-ribbon protein
MLLSIVLSLGILASINGGSLKFATQTEFRQQQLALNELDNQSKLLVDELDGMHERLTNLEALSGRISTLEKSVGAVQGEMDVAHKQLDEFSGELEVLTEQIVRLAADVETYKAKLNRADTFFESMRNLLNNLYPEE